LNTAEDLEVAVVAPAEAQRVSRIGGQVKGNAVDSHVNVFTKKATPVDSITC